MGSRHQFISKDLQGRHSQGIEAMVHSPTVVDSGMRIIDIQMLQSFARSDINAVGRESDVVDLRACAASAKIPSFLDFATGEIHHHHTEARGKVGVATMETDVEDAFVARQFATLDVGEIVDTVVTEDVDIRVVVGQHKGSRSSIVAHGRDAHIAESVAFAKSIEDIVVEVEIEESPFGGSIYTVAGVLHMIDLGVVEAVAPLSYRHLGLRLGSHDGEQQGSEQNLGVHTVVSFFRKIYW